MARPSRRATAPRLSFAEALAYLDDHTNLERSTGLHTDAAKLDRMRALVRWLGDPQHAYDVIHVTGTNGKGTVTRVAAAILTEMGLSCGWYLSPHVEDICERMGQRGADITPAELAEQISAVAAVEPLSGVRPNYFEILTAAALRWFADSGLEVAVVEVGMLGRWDATNVCEADVAVVTNIGLDHTAYAGPTRAHVAREKAGIVTSGRPLVTAERDPEILSILCEPGPGELWRIDHDFAVTANDLAVGGRRIGIRTPGGEHEDLFVPLHGPWQAENVATAVAACEALLGRPLPTDVVADALAGVRIPGRLEVLGRQPLVILDGAHNTEAATALRTAVEEAFVVSGPRVVVVGLLKGHGDPVEVLAALGVADASLVVATAPDWPRAHPAETVAGAARAAGAPAVQVVPRVPDAVDRALAVAGTTGSVLVCGSFYVVGEARTHLRTRPGAPTVAP